MITRRLILITISLLMLASLASVSRYSERGVATASPEMATVSLIPPLNIDRITTTTTSTTVAPTTTALKRRASRSYTRPSTSTTVDAVTTSTAEDSAPTQVGEESPLCGPGSKTVAEAHRCWDGLLGQYPWDTSRAFRIMFCESHGNPAAKNPRSSATGLFQILHGPYDPVANVAQAYSMYKSRGWQPWVCR